VTLVATHLGPVTPEVAPMANGTLVSALFCIFAVPTLGSVPDRMSPGTVVALVAGHVAPAPAIIVAVAITTVQGAEILDKGTVSVF
jgi:hypothetical protein